MTDPTLTAALGQDGAWLFGAIRMELPGKTLCLLDGSGVLSFGGYTYTGEDAEFGTIAALDVISEGMGDEAPEVRLSLNPADATALATLCNPAMQGSRVSIFVGVANIATMALIGAPELIFLGEIDVPKMTSGSGGRTVDYTLVSIFERLFEVDEGQRATDGFHQSIWPGETGLSAMTGTPGKLYWGAKNPPAAMPSYNYGYPPYGYYPGY